MNLSRIRFPAAATIKRRLGHATEPHIRFPAIAVLVLAVIWGATGNLMAVERTAAERSAAVSARELPKPMRHRVVRAPRRTVASRGVREAGAWTASTLFTSALQRLR